MKEIQNSIIQHHTQYAYRYGRHINPRRHTNPRRLHVRPPGRCRTRRCTALSYLLGRLKSSHSRNHREQPYMPPPFPQNLPSAGSRAQRRHYLRNHESLPSMPSRPLPTTSHTVPRYSRVLLTWLEADEGKELVGKLLASIAEHSANGDPKLSCSTSRKYPWAMTFMRTTECKEEMNHIATSAFRACQSVVDAERCLGCQATACVLFRLLMVKHNDVLSPMGWAWLNLHRNMNLHTRLSTGSRPCFTTMLSDMRPSSDRYRDCWLLPRM
jgi:hypothetical protein